MLKSETGMPTTKSGFTLIEILVVLVILGITASVALLAFGDFGESRHIEAEAERFLQTTRLIHHHALLEATTYGMKITPSSYQIFRFTPPNTWIPVKSALLKSYRFPEKTLLHLDIEATNKQHLIIFQASGEITPFTITFGLKQQPSIAHVIAKDNGTIFLKRGFN